METPPTEPGHHATPTRLDTNAGRSVVVTEPASVSSGTWRPPAAYLRGLEVGGSPCLTALAQAGTDTVSLEASPKFDRPAGVVPMRVPAQATTACRPSTSEELTEVRDKVIAEFVAEAR
ncbi:hypothetical protein GCM10010211_77660 [Streptomyces albospinus]|uniref:Uncharacterized protein n=1 Tax=Streptomyces albospinus TaxID=285515 RepID=A0ABQ2VMA3_9ACTN|nr:hypothetical protein GCM10010211_77660 [Streptomyces albospinus]